MKNHLNRDAEVKKEINSLGLGQKPAKFSKKTTEEWRSALLSTSHQRSSILGHFRAFLGVFWKQRMSNNIHYYQDVAFDNHITAQY